MGFDYAAYNAQKSGQNPDKGLIVTFRYEAIKNKAGEFENVPFINIYLGKNDTVDRRVTEEDKLRFADRWEAFERNEEVPPEGTPINMVPFAMPSDIASCKAEKIYTAEQLVETPDARLQRAHLLNFKYSCKDMLDAKARNGEYKDLKQTIDKQQRLIEDLQSKLEAKDKPKRRGRPRKVDVNKDDSQ